MPVRLFSGARSSSISFHMLHRDDLTRIKQQLYCPTDNRVVERSEIVKGYEYRKDEYVVVEPEEIKKIEPRTAKTMEILEFVKSSEVDPIFFESSYYMTPEEAGRRPYALLTKALEESEYFAIAKLTMHNREYTVFLRPHEGGMMLHTMYYAEEVRKVEGFGAPDVELKEAEVKVAHQLIEALADEWDPEKYTVEDLGIGFVRFENGATLTLEASFAANLEKDVFNTDLFGTGGGCSTSQSGCSISTYSMAPVGQAWAQAGSPPQRSHLKALWVSG